MVMQCYTYSKNIYCFGSTSTVSIFIAMLDYPANNVSVFAMNYFVRNFWHSTSLHCLKQHAESCHRARTDQVIWRGQYLCSCDTARRLACKERHVLTEDQSASLSHSCWLMLEVSVPVWISVTNVKRFVKECCFTASLYGMFALSCETRPLPSACLSVRL